MKKLLIIVALSAFAQAATLDLEKECKKIVLEDLRRQIIMLRNMRYTDVTWELSEKEFLYNFGKIFCKDYQ